MKPKLSEWGLRRPSAAILIVGGPGSGKTVLAYDIADQLRGDRPVYVPMSECFNRPDYYKRSPPGVEGDYVEIASDAALTSHARDWAGGEAILQSKIQSIRRHRNADLIFDVQNAGILDISIIRQVDCLILKEPSVMQEDFERPPIKDKYEKAEEMLDNTRVGGARFPTDWDQTNAVVWTHKRSFVLTGIELPRYWNQDISEDDVFRQQAQEEKSIWRKLPRLF